MKTTNDRVHRVCEIICSAGGYGLCAGFCHQRPCRDAFVQYEMTAYRLIDYLDGIKDVQS